MTIYGFAEVDAMYDTTQSYGDYMGGAVLARPGSYGATHGRMQFTIRNSRIGFKVDAPEFWGIRSIAVLEGDFFGNQPTTASEAALFNNPTFRIRHAYLKMETAYIDVLGGQTYDLFGQQSYFFPAALTFLGLPGEIFGRTAQVRFYHSFKTDPVDIYLGVAVLRPPQRDSQTPEGQAAARLAVNKWKGVHTPGSLGTAVDAAAIGVSGTVRHFQVSEFSGAPVHSNAANGWGVSVDALLPIIPAKSMENAGNSLTLTGSFVTGTGIADKYTGMTAGVTFPALPNPMMTMPAPTYTPNIDNGMVTYDAMGGLHTINWTSFMIGAQYYLPPSGRVFVSGNFHQLSSNNSADGLDAKGQAKVFTKLRYIDASIFFDITQAIRLAGSYVNTNETFGDGMQQTNHRGELAGLYLF
jgi:hypothetical protein